MSDAHTPAKILVIDDEEAMRDSCTQALTKVGYEVVSAGDGASGLELAKKVRPDIVLVDLKMPGISGHEVLDLLGKLDASIVRVVITGYATRKSMQETQKLGAVEFLSKPFTPAELRDVILNALRKKKPPLETRSAS